MCGSSLMVLVVYRYTAFFEREYVTAGASLCSLYKSDSGAAYTGVTGLSMSLDFLAEFSV